jgi:hypothetical protein
MDLRTLDNESLQKIVSFAERLVDLQNGQIDFDNPDLEQAEKQALQFVEAKRAGRSGKTEIESDTEIRNGVREFLKKRAIYRTEKAQDLSVTKPNY